MDACPVFHLFSYLPFELRREIYIFATPPRVVHVRESWDFEHPCELLPSLLMSSKKCEDLKIAYAFEEFKERHRSKPLQVKLHPDLVHFARNWRRRIPFRSGTHVQSSLESYGFTSKTGYPQPWPPTDDTPEIPLRWLENHLDVAFELVRESHLYSDAPIPPLLHTCFESRKALMDYGYRIAFGTRSTGPRTWFHFGRDRLYISERCRDVLAPGDPGSILSADSSWDIIGQFDPKDSRQVKNLVLGRGCRIVDDLLFRLENILPLFPNLDELFLEEWDKECVDDWFGETIRLPSEEVGCSDGGSETSTSSRYRAEEIWKCVPAEEIDLMAGVFCCDPDFNIPADIYSSGHSLGLFKHYQDNGPRGLSFFDAVATRIQQSLFQRRVDSDEASWNVPHIKMVHTCSATVAERLVHGRLAFWRHYMELRKVYARNKPFKPLTVDGPAPPPPFHVYLMCNEFPDAFRKAQEMSATQLRIHGANISHLQGWYLTRGSAMEPTLEIL
ncbi:hypothetical protein GGR54DRAFT_637533 [Hypoxylon sp. NC1633]|nr:hypothetical protein GGR54DRAFT_637533 [Hypoxylon sp. NC1633]